MTGFLRRADGFLRREDGFLRKQSPPPIFEAHFRSSASITAALEVPPPEHDFEASFLSVSSISAELYGGPQPGTQIYWTPNPADLGQAPGGFSVPYGGAELEVKQDSEGRYYLEISGTDVTARSPILIDSINGIDLSSVRDVEMWSHIKTIEDDDNGGTDHRHMFRYSGDSIETTDCYYHGWQSTFNRVRVSYWTNNSGTNLESLGGWQMGPSAEIFVRSRINGTTLTTKPWRGPDPEPEEWLIELTDDTITDPGGLGFWRENGPFPQRIYAIGIGIGGVEAPDGPIDTGLSASLSATAGVYAHAEKVALFDSSFRSFAGLSASLAEQVPEHSFEAYFTARASITASLRIESFIIRTVMDPVDIISRIEF